MASMLWSDADAMHKAGQIYVVDECWSSYAKESDTVRTSAGSTRLGINHQIVSLQQLLELCFAILLILIFVLAGQCLALVTHMVPRETGVKFFHVIRLVAQLCLRVGHSCKLASVNIWMSS